MNQKLKKEIVKLIGYYNLNCSIEEFENKANWYHISQYQYLSESFIREFKNKVEWTQISSNQKLSEKFIKEFQDNVIYENISLRQNL